MLMVVPKITYSVHMCVNADLFILYLAYYYAWTILERGDFSRKEKKDTEGFRDIRLLR